MGYTAPFWSAAELGAFIVQADDDDRPQFPPRPLSVGDPQGGLRWRSSTGRGRIIASTYKASDRPAQCLALVELDEGFRVLANTSSRRDVKPKIGDRVCLVWHPRDGAAPIFAFEVEHADHGA